jgi:hypothetical protein
MRHTVQAIEECGGFASRWQLRAWGVSSDAIDVAAWYGRRVIRVRKGWYARADEDEQVIRAWRVGGRLTRVSAIAFHDGAPKPPVLHVEVPANSPRLRDPDKRHRSLGPEAAVPGSAHGAPAAMRAARRISSTTSRGRRSGSDRFGSPHLLIAGLCGGEGVRVEDRVAVALLGEEALTVLSEILVDGVAGDEGVEVSGKAALLRAKQAAQALGFLLA